jgi:3-hydroxyisobutyrate dehydrogenase-like beta-hydroxyacid dehydrogenase
LSEAFAFARKSGIDAAVLLDFFTSTIFNVPVYKTYGALIVEGKHEQVGFGLPLGLKDVRLVLQAAERQSVPMPIASVLRDRFVTALARGYEDKDWSVIGRVAAEDAGLTRATHA